MGARAVRMVAQSEESLTPRRPRFKAKWLSPARLDYIHIWELKRFCERARRDKSRMRHLRG